MASAVKYIANVTKSVKYATIDVLKEMNPVVTDMIDTNQDVAKVTYSSIKNFKSLSAKAMKSLSQSQVGELARDYKKNLLEDIKNGTFYNKKRQEQVESEIGNSDAWGADMSDFFAEEPMEEDDFSADNFGEVLDDTAERATSAVSQVLARTSEYQVEATRQSTNRILAQTSAMSAQLHSDLGVLNANVSGLMKFNTEAMATHIENSRAFYERQQQQMDEQTSILREMLEFQKSIYTPKTKSMSSKVNVSDIFTSTGAINLAEYFKLIKQNAENMDSMGLGSWVKEAMDSGMGKSFAANPLGLVMTGAVKSFFPKILKDTFKEFNDTLSGSISTAIMNAYKAKDSTNPIVSALGNIFGVDISNSRRVSTSKYNKDAVAWNGKDHKALTEVIPTLLNKIYSSISGTKEMRYDYNEGKFVSLKDIKKSYNRRKSRYVSDANDTIMPYLENMINQMNFSSTDRQKEFVSHLETILKENFKKGQYFNPNDKSISAKTYGLKGDHAEYDVQLIRRLMAKIPKSKQLLNNTDFFQAREQFQDWLSSIEGDGDSVFMSLFNGSTGKKKGKSKTIVSPIMTASEKLDETNSLLREIRDTLQSRGRSKRPYKKVTKKNTNTTINKIEKKENNKETGYISDLGFYVNTRSDAKFNVDEDDIDSFDYVDPDTVDNKTYIKRLKEATTATKRLSAFLSGTSELAKQPLRFVSNVLKKTDERMYTLLFGSDKDNKNSILGKITDGLDLWFDDLRDIARNKFEDIKDWLTEKSFGDKAHGILSKLLGIDTKEWFKDFRKAAFGDENMSMGEGVRKIFSEGFREMWTGFKNFFKEDETVKSAKEAIAGTITQEEEQRRKNNAGLDNLGKALRRAAADHGNDTGEGKVTDIHGAAKGLRKVSKTGVIAVSEGEMIVPPDMNPYNIKKREKSEKDAIDKFEKVYGKFGSIPAYATGGSVDIDPEKKAKLDKQVSRIDSIIARGNYDPKKIILDISKFPTEDQEYIMSHINDDSYATLHRNYKAARAMYKVKSLGRDAYEKGKENIGYKMADAAKDVLSDARENEFVDSLIAKISQSINKNKDTSAEGKEVVNDIMSNFSSYLPRIAAGGVTGLALSAMLGLAGGPLLGAAVGSGLGLLSNSKKLQKWLFGEKLVDDEGNETIKGGILGNDLKKNLHKYFPNMSKGAILGGIASVLPFVPGGPMAGILVGSAIGFAKSNDDLREKLFGEDKALSKIGKTLKEKLPRMGLGAAAMFLGGPFGVTTNLMVGSALGFVSDTEKFKDIIFGTKGFDNKRRGGLVGFIKDAVEIPVNGIKNLFEYSKNWFKKDILDPMARFLKPALQDFKNLGSWIKDGIKSAFTDHLLRPIGGKILSKLIVPLEKQLGKIVKPFAHGLLAVASAPFKALGAYGDWRRSRQLRSVGGASGTITERVLARNQMDSKRPGRFTRAINGIAGRDIINTTKYTDSEANRIDMTFLGMSDEDRMMAGTLAEMVESTGLNKRKNREKAIKGNIASLISKQGGLDKVIYSHIDRTNAEMVAQYNQMKNEMLTGKCQASIAILKSWVLAGKFPAKYENEAIRELKRVAKLVSERRDKLNNLDQSIKDFQDKTGINMLDRKHRKVAKQAAKEAQADSDKAINDYYSNVVEEANQGTLEEQQLKAALRMQEIQEEISKKLTDINDTLKDILVGAADTTDDNPDISTDNNYKVEQEASTVSENGKLLPAVISDDKTPDDQRVEVSATDIITAAQAGQLDIARIMADGKVNKFSKLKSIGNKIISNFRSKKQKSQTIITENGPIKTRFDNRGNEIPDNTDSETKETLAKVEDKNKVQKGILNKLSGLGDTIKGFLGIGDDKEEKEEGIFSKILKGALKYGLPILGGLAGVGLVSKIANKKVNVQARDANGNKMFDENGNPIMTQMTIAEAVKDGASRMWLGDDLTGNTSGAWFHVKDFTRNKVIPLIGSGIDLIVEKIPSLISTGVQTIIEHAPQLLGAIGVGIAKGIWSVLSKHLSNIPVIGNLFKSSDKESGEKSSKEIEGGKSTLKVDLANGKKSGSSSTTTSDTTDALQSMYDTAAKSTNNANQTGVKLTTNTTTYSTTKINKSQQARQNVLYSLTSANNNTDNTKLVKESLAYQNASKPVQKKSLQALAAIWNDPVLADGTTVGELCNNPNIVVAEFEDNNGNIFQVTGATILLYPETASQLFGIDISLTDKEREENSKEIEQATNSNPGNWALTKIIASKGTYGNARTTTRALTGIGNLVARGGKAVNRVFGKDGLGRLPWVGRGFKTIGRATNVLARATQFTANAASIPVRAVNAIKGGVSEFYEYRNAGYTAKQSMQWMAGRTGANIRTGIRNAKESFNAALDSRSAVRAASAAEAGKGLKGTKTLFKNSISEKFDNLARKVGNKGLDIAEKAAGLSSSDATKAASDIQSALQNMSAKGGKSGKLAGKAAKLTGQAAEVVSKFSKALSEFLQNSKIIGAFKKVLKCAGIAQNKIESVLQKGLIDFAEKLTKRFTKGIAGAGAKLVSKVAKQIAKKVLAVVFIVVDFLNGMAKADVIMRVEKPTVAERLVAGLVNALAEFCFITLIIQPSELVDMCVSALESMGFNFDSLRERQQEAQENCDEYQRKTGVKISVEEYLMNDHLSTKIKKALGKVGSTIVNFGKSIGNGIKNFFTGGGNSEEEVSVDATNSTVDQVTAAEDTVAGSYVYDDSGNVIGYDNNSDGNVESMYIPQGDSSESSIAGIDTEFNTTGVSSNETVDSTSSIVNTKVDQSQLATSGTGSVISSENQSLINSAYNEINTSIPDMVRQVKTNLANYFGVKPSDLNRTTNVGMNTMKGDGPLQLFRRLNLMWSQVNTTLGPFIRNLPATLYSGIKDLTKFLTNNVGLTTDDEVIDMEEEAEAIGTSSGYSSTSTTTNQSSDSSTTTGKASTSSSSSSNSSKKKKKDSIFTKISKGVKNVVKGIGNFFGIGGSGSGVDDSVISDYDRSSDKGSFISQKYGKYANRQFTVTGDKQRETVADAGCAPAVATMAINSAGYSADPITMDQAMKTAIKYKKPNAGVTADYFVDEFDKHGLNASYITSDSSKMKETIVNKLFSGTPIILMGKDDKNKTKSSSPFGPKTHYVVATGISKDKQTIYVNDPEAKTPRIPYKTNTVLNGVMLGISPVIRANSKNKNNSMLTKIKRMLSNFSASGKYGPDTIQYKVWNGLRAAGYNEIAVAAAMGNIQMESGFDPSVVERGSGLGFGLVQWTGGRRTAIEKYAADQGRDVNDVNLQIEFLVQELKGDGIWMENRTKNYSFGYLTKDDWENGTDIVKATQSFMGGFEGPDYNDNKNHIADRIEYAKMYYEEFTGTPIDATSGNNTTTGGESEASQSPIEKLLSAFTELAKGYGLTGGDSSGTTEDSGSGDDGSGYVNMGDIRGNVSTNKEYAQKQVELVKKMKSVENQLVYAQNNAKYPGSRNPDDGSGDCSSTVQWAYQKVLGVDPGSWTGAQETDEDTYTVTNSTAEEDKMQLGDIILKDGHVEMYYGDHRMIGHGGGQHTLEDGTVTKKGPFVRELGSTPPYNHIKRWVGFRDGENSTTFDGATEGGAGSGVFVSQNNSSYANKTIGNRTVADAGCAPAVATMALSKMNKNYNMITAIKDATKYQNSSGKVTADYFADTFTKNGIRPSFIPGNNIDKLKKSITNGNVVLLGKDSSNNTKSRSPFGPSGHYVLATGLSSDGKYVYIDDPESKKANQKYPVDILKHTSLGISTFGNITSKIADKIKDKLKLLAGTAKYKYLFSGDSRTVGIQLSLGDSKPDTLFVAKAGIGYQWMKDHAWSQIKQNLNDNPDMKVVFLYGVNDMININYYLKRYKELEGEYNKNRIWYVSVNPIRGQQLVTDDQIKEFNTKLKEHAGSRYIDTYSMLQKDGFGSYDGLHYDNDTNIKIYDFIINAINNGGSTSNTTTSNKNTITEVEQDPSPLSELTAAFAELAQGYGLTGKSGSTSTSSSNNNNNNSNNSSTKGSSFPKYDLTDAQKKLAAGVIAGETGGADLVAAKQEASQMANLNEVQYGKDATGSNLESTLTGGWYAKASLSKSPTDTTLKAVEEVLVNGKRTLPRYVTEHDMFPLDAAISGHWNNGKSEDRSQYKRNSTVIHQNPSRFSSPASYKFYDFFGENRDGDVAGYYDQYYDQYKDDVAWSGAGSGLSSDTKPTPSYNYSKSTTKPVIIESTSSNNQKSSNVDKLIEVVVKLLSQVVNNTSSIKDIASLLVKLVDLKGSDDSGNSNSAINTAMTSSQLALQALRESTRTTEDEEIMKLIKSVESIAMQ